MPTYSYACTECGDRFDAVQAFTDDALTTCAKCSGRLRKLFNSVGVVFKGSGFYRTDSRADGTKAKSSTNGSSGDASSGSSDKTGSTDKAASSDKGGSSDKSSSAATPAAAAASS